MGPLAVDIDPTYLIPDLTVVTQDRALRNVNPVPSADVLLCVEFVSPGSRTMDRIVKPAKYAQGGIPSYWRVETRPHVALTEYRLEGDVYAEVGTWGPGETAELTAPFPVAIEIDALSR